MGDRRGHGSSRDHERSSRRHRSRSNGEARGHHEEREAPEWSWASTIVSIVSMTVFVSWFGIIGMLFAGLAYTDHKVGDYKRSHFKQRWAWCCSLTGIIVTIIAIVLLMLVMYAFDVPKPTFGHHAYWIPYWLYNELGNTTTS